MFVMQDAVTVTVKACASCRGGLLEYDKFCRWCGERQADQDDTSLQLSAAETVAASGSLSPYITSALERAETQEAIYSRVSGPLVSAIIAGVSANPPKMCSRLAKKAVFALMSIPIWLIILLLSPLDAYAATKNLLKEE